MKRILTATSAAVWLLLLGSCDILRDRPFTVDAWTPGPGFHAPDGFSAVTLTFSSEPDRVSVEQAFSLEVDGDAVRGGYAWEGKTLKFVPYAPFTAKADYNLSVSVDAQDEDGVSMSVAFEETFTTRQDGPRPTVTSTVPADGGTVPSDTSSVIIAFASPVDAAACRDGVSFSPSRSGSWSVDATRQVATFTPAERWPLDEETEVTVSSDLRGLEGRRSGVEHRFSFRVGEDREAPYIILATALNASGDEALVLAPDDQKDAVVTENANWEGAWRLSLRFSEAVELSTLDGRLRVENGPTLRRETAQEKADVAVYRFTERPEWGTRFAFRIDAGLSDGAGNVSSEAALFRVVADGPRSRPPRFVGVRLPLAPGELDPADQALTAYSADDPFADLNITVANYPDGIATPTEIELYFELAQGAALDRYSIMESFRVEATGDVVSFSTHDVVTDDFPEPTPYAPWAAYARCLVQGDLTNQIDAGVVTFSLRAGLKDSEGNKTTTAAALPLNK